MKKIYKLIVLIISACYVMILMTFIISSQENESTEAMLTYIYQQIPEGMDIEEVYFDFNNDGVQELILREAEGKNDFYKRIIAILGKKEDGYSNIVWDMESPEKYFALNEEHFFYCEEYVDSIQYNCYVECFLDDNYELQRGQIIEIFNIENMDKWKEDADAYIPVQSEKIDAERRYYRKSVLIGDKVNYELITKFDWYTLFEEITGKHFLEVEPNWHEAYERKKRKKDEEIYEIFQQEWIVSEFLGWRRTFTGEENSDEYYSKREKEIKEQYLGKVLYVDEEHIEYFGSSQEIGYEYETYDDLFLCYRHPFEVDDLLEPPFFGADIKLKDEDDITFKIIIDKNNNAVLSVKDAFFRLEKQ